MKEIFIGLVGLLLLNALSCKKGTLPQDYKTLKEATYLTLTSATNLNIDYSQRTTASVEIKVGSVGGPAVDKVVVYAVIGADLDKTKWKKVKEFAYSDGVALTLKATEIATALGVNIDDLTPGTVLTLYNEAITKNGQSFSLANITTDFESQAPFNMAMRWTVNVVCPFDAAQSAGTYKVVYDNDWQDFAVGDEITVTAGPGANQISMLAYPSPAYGFNRKPIVIDVSASGVATIKPQVFGDYTGVPNCMIQGSGIVFSCTGYISLTNTITYGGSDYTGLKFIIQKN